MAWITNDENAAMLLRAADAMYERARGRATNLPLAQKIAALSAARQIRDAAYKLAGGADKADSFTVTP